MDMFKLPVELFPLYLSIFLVSFIIFITIILYQLGDDPLFEVLNAQGTKYDKIASAGERVTVDASKTSSLAGGPIEFTWTQIEGPPGT